MKTNNLPFIKIDARLSAITGFQVGEKQQSNKIIKGLWAYIRSNNLKV